MARPRLTAEFEEQPDGGVAWRVIVRAEGALDQIAYGVEEDMAMAIAKFHLAAARYMKRRNHAH